MKIDLYEVVLLIYSNFAVVEVDKKKTYQVVFKVPRRGVMARKASLVDYCE